MITRSLGTGGVPLRLGRFPVSGGSCPPSVMLIGDLISCHCVARGGSTSVLISESSSSSMESGAVSLKTL